MHSGKGVEAMRNHMPRLLLPFLLLVFIQSCFGTVSFKVWRFTVTKVRAKTSFRDKVQVTDFKFIDSNGATLTPDQQSCTAPTPFFGSSPSGEEPAKAIDGDGDTKWVDEKNEPFVILCSSDLSVASFSFRTGNDSPERDPVRWKMEGSDSSSGCTSSRGCNGQTWTMLNEQTSDYATPTARKEWIPNISLGPPTLAPTSMPTPPTRAPTLGPTPPTPPPTPPTRAPTRNPTLACYCTGNDLSYAQCKDGTHTTKSDCTFSLNAGCVWLCPANPTPVPTPLIPTVQATVNLAGISSAQFNSTVQTAFREIIASYLTICGTAGATQCTSSNVTIISTNRRSVNVNVTFAIETTSLATATSVP